MPTNIEQLGKQVSALAEGLQTSNTPELLNSLQNQINTVSMDLNTLDQSTLTPEVRADLGRRFVILLARVDRHLLAQTVEMNEVTRKSLAGLQSALRRQWTPPEAAITAVPENLRPAAEMTLGFVNRMREFSREHTWAAPLVGTLLVGYFVVRPIVQTIARTVMHPIQTTQSILGTLGSWGAGMLGMEMIRPGTTASLFSQARGLIYPSSTPVTAIPEVATKETTEQLAKFISTLPEGPNLLTGNHTVTLGSTNVRLNGGNINVNNRRVQAQVQQRLMPTDNYALVPLALPIPIAGLVRRGNNFVLQATNPLPSLDGTPTGPIERVLTPTEAADVVNRIAALGSTFDIEVPFPPTGPTSRRYTVRLSAS